MGFELNATQIEMLEARTEGWVSGLQLAAISMKGHADVDDFVRSFAGSNRYILDYLIEEVFQQQSPEIQEFLLQTSILDQLTASLCDALISPNGNSGAPNSQQLLLQLERTKISLLFLLINRENGSIITSPVCRSLTSPLANIRI